MSFWSLRSCPHPTMSEQLGSMKGENLYVGFSKERGRDSEKTAPPTGAARDLHSTVLSGLPSTVVSDRPRRSRKPGSGRSAWSSIC